MIDKALMSSSSEYWCTPNSILDVVRTISLTGKIQLDPCGNGYSLVDAVEEWIPPAHDGLTEDWTSAAKGGLVFVNPPYGRSASPQWTQKIKMEAAKGCEIVALLPARTDTKWFHSLIKGSTFICYIKGRIRFIDGLTGNTKAGAPFPSCLMYFGNKPLSFAAACTKIGFIATLKSFE